MRRTEARGQATLELLAAVPLLVLAALLAWQLAAVVGAGMEAEQRVRAEALRAGPAPGGVAVLTVTRAVPAVLPGAGGLSITAGARVRTP